MMRDERLLLLAQDAADLGPISALVQDALLMSGDVAFDRRGRRLVLMVSRYRWETTDPSRVRAALRFESVLSVQRRHWPADPATPLDLLAVHIDGQSLTLDFAGGAALRLSVECLEAVLEDLSAPWPVNYTPDHA